jgi:hypothetical protein
VTFALKLTNSTRIQSGEQKLRPENLNLLMDKTVSVRFTPTRSGNVAIAVQVLTQESELICAGRIAALID